jgi:hypothetical protein
MVIVFNVTSATWRGSARFRPAKHTWENSPSPFSRKFRAISLPDGLAVSFGVAPESQAPFPFFTSPSRFVGAIAAFKRVDPCKFRVIQGI